MEKVTDEQLVDVSTSWTASIDANGYSLVCTWKNRATVYVMC